MNPCLNGFSTSRAITAIIFGAALASSSHAFAAKSDASKPNIVLIISDDQRYDTLGVAKNPNIHTPNIDRMVHEGLYFPQGTIHIPTCSASRATILTGIPPHENGWYSNETQRKDVTTFTGLEQYTLLPNVLAKANYHTAFTGKWHQRTNPWNCGFEDIRHWILGGMGPYLGCRMANGKSRDIKTMDDYTQKIFADDAIDILKKQSSGQTTQPLFLWLAFTAPHAPFTPNPAPFNDMYTSKTPTQLAPPTFGGNPDNTKFRNQEWDTYYAAVSELDDQIGRVMSTIRGSSISDNTLVIFIGDNGYMMGSRNMHGKYVPYEESVRVPFAMWGSSKVLPAKGESDACVSSIDLSPTIAKIAGAPIPSQWAGRDLTPVLKDGKPHEITYSISEYPDYISLLLGNIAYREIRTTDSKLIIRHPESGMPTEFYDLAADPHETHNVYNKVKDTPKVKALQSILDTWRQKTHDTWTLKGPLVTTDYEDRGPAKKDLPLVTPVNVEQRKKMIKKRKKNHAPPIKSTQDPD